MFHSELHPGHTGVQTPEGILWLSPDQMRFQQARFQMAADRLGGLWGYNFLSWIQMFGVITDSDRFGREVWQGLLRIALEDAKLMMLMSGPQKLLLGWFVAPIPLSFHGAQQPPTAEELAAYPYPAIFSGDPGYYCTDHLRRSRIFRVRCLKIIIERTRTWWVHEGRMILVHQEFFQWWINLNLP